MHFAICNVFCLFVALAGCGVAEGPDTVSVSGTVTYQQRPVEGANVVFHPIETSEARLASQAVTDASGRFDLRTHVGGGEFKPGIRPGRYAVSVTKFDTASVANTLAPPKNLLPKKYSEAKSSGLSADVAAGKENSFAFTLTAD